MLQQVFPLIQTLLSRWLDDSEVVEVGVCFFFVLHGVRVYVFACIIYIHSSPFPSLQAVCGVFDKSVRTLLHDFGPMVAQLSGMLGQIYGAFPQASALDLARQVRPPADQGLDKRIIPLKVMETQTSFSLFSFRLFTYLLGRKATSLTSKALSGC